MALTLITAASFAVFYFLPPESFGLLLAVNAVGTFCMRPTSALVWAMYADVADYGEWKFGRRSTGLVYSASLFALKTGTMIAGALLPLFLDYFGCGGSAPGQRGFCAVQSKLDVVSKGSRRYEHAAV